MLWERPIFDKHGNCLGFSRVDMDGAAVGDDNLAMDLKFAADFDIEDDYHAF